MTLALHQQPPDFDLKNQHGEDIRLSGFRGHRPVVVMFFPFAFSSICTSELREVRGAVSDLQQANVELLAISCDPMFALRAFSDAEAFSFSLLSDFWPHGEVARRYGVFDERRGYALRGTFVVDIDGVLRWMMQNGMPDARNWSTVRRAIAAI